MFRGTRIFIALTVGLAIFLYATTMPDFGTQMRTFYAGILWFCFCMWVGHFIEKCQADTDE